ncbi:putative troponin C [Cyclospora cayetanensis]|uniref:Troponin C n=1 Tax=Cyclospora cayetanensis TaxID=88456 RepID=A0A1D3D0F4_9EIME|nr:putative troponin C [Cyclospora cayetanensis]
MGKAPRRSPPDEAYQEGPLLAPCESEKAETISTGADGETSRREPPSQPRLLSSLLPAAALPSASRSRWLEETSRAELVRSTAFLASARSAAEGAVSAFGDGSLAWLGFEAPQGSNISTSNISTSNISTSNISTSTISKSNINPSNTNTSNISTSNISTSNSSGSSPTGGSSSDNTAEVYCFLPNGPQGQQTLQQKRDSTQLLGEQVNTSSTPMPISSAIATSSNSGAHSSNTVRSSNTLSPPSTRHWAYLWFRRLLRSSAALLPPGLYGGGSLLGSQTLHHEAAVPSIAASAAKITGPTQEPRAAAAPPTAQDTPDYLECCHAVPRRSSSTAFLPESFSVDAPGCAPDTATSVSLTSAAGASAFVAFLPGAAASTAVTPVAADGLNDAAATAAIRAVADVEDLGNGGCLPWEPSVHEPSDDNCKNSSFTDTADGSDGLAIRLKHEQQVQSKLKQQKEKERQRLQQQGRRQHEVRLLAAAAARLCLEALAATERSLRLATDLVGQLKGSLEPVFPWGRFLRDAVEAQAKMRTFLPHRLPICFAAGQMVSLHQQLHGKSLNVVSSTSNISPFPPLLVLPPLPVRQKNREMLLLLYHQQQQERLPKRAAPPHLPSYCETSKASFVTMGLPVRLTKHLVPSANDGSEIPKASCPIPHEFPITSIGRSSERLSQQGATADCSCRFCSAAEGYLPGAFPWLGGSSIAASLCSFNSGKNSVRGLSRDPFDSGEDVGLLDYKLVLDRAEMLLTLVAEQIAAAAIAQTSQASACGSSIQANEPSTDSWAPKCHIRKGAQLNTPGSPDSTIVRIPGFLEAAAVAPNPSLTDAAAMYISVGDSAAAAVEAAADLNVAPILCSGVSLRLVASRVLLEFLEGANACTQLRFKVAELTKWLDHLRLVSKELSDQYQQ